MEIAMDYGVNTIRVAVYTLKNFISKGSDMDFVQYLILEELFYLKECLSMGDGLD